MCVEGLMRAPAQGTRMVSFRGTDVRTPHFIRASRKSQRPVAKSQMIPRPGPHCFFGVWRLKLWSLHAPRVLAPRLHPRPESGIGFARRLPPVGVCDALPQRNCGRIARPSLFPWNLMKEPQAGHKSIPPVTYASPIPVRAYVINRPGLSPVLLFHIIES